MSSVIMGIIFLVIGIVGLGVSPGFGLVCIGIAILDFWAASNQAKNDDIRHKNDYGTVSRCPKCGSTKVYLMTWDDKRDDVAFWGTASTKIGKRYHCDDCNYEW